MQYAQNSMQARKSLCELPAKRYEGAAKHMQVFKTLFKPVKLYASVQILNASVKLYASVENYSSINLIQVFKTFCSTKVVVSVQNIIQAQNFLMRV